MLFLQRLFQSSEFSGVWSVFSHHHRSRFTSIRRSLDDSRRRYSLLSALFTLHNSDQLWHSNSNLAKDRCRKESPRWNGSGKSSPDISFQSVSRRPLPLVWVVITSLDSRAWPKEFNGGISIKEPNRTTISPFSTVSSWWLSTRSSTWF